MRLRVLSVVLAMLAAPSIAAAQTRRVYVGGALDIVTQTRSDTNPMGGTNWGGRALVGVRATPHLAFEFEPMFNGSYSWQFSYRPTPTITANEVVSRRNTFFSGQARISYGVVEPVLGFSYINAHTRRYATFGNSLYFDDRASNNRLAAVVGVDAAVPLTSRVSFVPTMRVLMRVMGETDFDTSVGGLTMRYGAGIRTTF